LLFFVSCYCELLRADDDDTIPAELCCAVRCFTSFLPLNRDLIRGYTVLVGQQLSDGTSTLFSETLEAAFILSYIARHDDLAFVLSELRGIEDRDQLILGDNSLTLLEEDGLIRNEAVSCGSCGLSELEVGAAFGALSQLCILSTELGDLSLETVDIVLIQWLNRGEALTTDVEGKTSQSRQTTRVVELISGIVGAKREVVVGSFTFEEDVYTLSNVESELDTSVPSQRMYVGHTLNAVVELVLIPKTNVRNQMEETILTVAGEVVHDIEHEVVVTTYIVVIVTIATRSRVEGVGLTANELKTVGIIRRVPLT